MAEMFAHRSVRLAIAHLLVGLCQTANGALGGEPAVDFTHDVAPLLSRHGCNASACHGKAEGQNGFRLSVFGSDPAADYEALTVASRGRRVTPAAAEHSLMLEKADGTLPHEGGIRLESGSPSWETVRHWIAGGAVETAPDRPALTVLQLVPAHHIATFREKLPLRVMAHFSDGSERDVTGEAVFHANDAGLADVDEAGVATIGTTPGVAAVLARYQGRVAVFQAVIPRAENPNIPLEPAPVLNDIDRLVDDTLAQLRLAPSGLADDATFLRRVTLDIIGRLPLPEEARRFLNDQSTNKRSQLVDSLLERPEYADYWALYWSDLLRVDRERLGLANAHEYYQWIHGAMAENRSLRDLTRDLLLAEGPLNEQPAGHFYRVSTKRGETAAAVAQVFLGIRIACAECHQHPYDQWTQQDYHGMRAYFEPVHAKPYGDSFALAASGNPQVKHPRTGAPIQPYPLGTTMPETSPEGDRRLALADWMTARENPWFARNLANRLWARFLGRGLVEPVDDMRATNPPGNPALMDRLARELVDHDYDAKAVIRFITGSRTYQLSSTPNASNAGDEKNFSRALFKRLPAEVLLDAVCDATGVPEKFTGLPAGLRAVQLWDSQAQHYFLKLFGRPARITPCECERASGASIGQALHLMNSPALQAKLSHEAGTAARLAGSGIDDDRVVETLYLSTFSRFPTAEELSNSLQYLGTSTQPRRQRIEDLLWSLLNSQEFVFNH